MPHTHTFIRDSAENPFLAEYNADPKGFTKKIASVVATAFNRVVGEALEPGVTSKSYPAVVSKSCPVDLVLDVVAWSDEQRAKHADAVKLAVEGQLSDWLDGRPTRVLMALVPACRSRHRSADA